MSIAKQQLNVGGQHIKIIVPVLPHLSNHADVDALCLHPNVDVHWIKMGDYIPKADLLILPDSENVVTDMQSLEEFGWGRALANQLRYGGKVLGIGAGFQMLGNAIHDPSGLTGEPTSQDAFGWLMMETILEKPKPFKPVTGRLCFVEAEVKGNEAQIGRSVGPALLQPALMLNDGTSLRAEGAMSADNQVAGTYVHGLFDHPEACAAWLKWVGEDS